MTPQQSLSQPATRPWSRDGFSLVELSIVLVILGLLTGGILAGQDLIRSAELRAVTTEFREYQTAVQTFRNKYMALPGDMDNATRFWGAANATPATCYDTAGTGTETCNGNGNGEIAHNHEALLAWEHLANAGLINGDYSGTGTLNAPYRNHVVGENAPASALGNKAGWSLLHNGTNPPNHFNGEYGNTLKIGQENSGSPSGPVLTPGEAWKIDTKMDDGQPARGDLVNRHTGGCQDTSQGANDDPGSADLDSVYEVTNDAIACNMIFRNVF